MDTGITAALIGIGMLVIINIVAVAYSYGKLSQKVNDFCQRVDRLEKIENGGK